MKNVKQTTPLFLALLIGLAASAQMGMSVGGVKIPPASKAKVKSGDVSALKGHTIKVTFVYDGMMVKKKAEADYIADKQAKYNAKEPGRGDKWATAWKSDRKSRFEPSFITKFNQLGKETGTQVSTDKGDVMLEVKTVYTDPGYTLGIDGGPSFINTICTFSGAVNAVVTIDKIPGETYSGMDWDTGARISESYEKCGKDLYKTIAKKFKK